MCKIKISIKFLKRKSSEWTKRRALKVAHSELGIWLNGQNGYTDR